MTALLQQTRVGESVSYIDMLRAIDNAVDEVFRVDFSRPAAWSTTPQHDIGAVIGTKLMPGTIQVEVRRW
jgi:hypothetical protein